MLPHPLFSNLATPVTQEKPISSLGLHSNMKQPKLPGAEKFKFSASDKPMSPNHVASPKHRLCTWNSQTSEPSANQPQFVFHSRTSSISSQNDLRPISTTLSVPMLNRSDSKRRAVLPITCRKTSRMLTNTNVELNVDPADIISGDTAKPTRLSMDSSRVPSCPNLETSSRSLNSSKTSLDTYFRKMSLQNSTIRELPPDFDWKNIRATPSRLSASCSSSCSSEENVWVLREDP